MLFTPQARAFRTAADLPELSDAGRVAWAEPQVSFHLSRAGLPEELREEQVEAALATALATWQAPDCSGVLPTFGGWLNGDARPADRTNTIVWTRDWAARDLPSSAPGNTEISYRTMGAEWVIADADILLNADDFDWTELSLEAVLAHELGHALGLLHPCEEDGAGGAPRCHQATVDETASLMYPTYSTEPRVELGVDDVEGICYLYPNSDECGGTCGPRQMCVSGGCRTLCGQALCEPDEQCGYWGCTHEDACLERDCEGQPCSNSDGCGPLLRCASGVCTSGSAAWGDACESNTDCANGACSEGACRPACKSDADCGTYGQCTRADGNEAGGCISSRAFPHGARCQHGEDCQSGLCVLSDGANRCTFPCDGDSACPSGWHCEAIKGVRACAPPQPDEGLCSLVSPPGSRPVAQPALTNTRLHFIALLAMSAMLLAARPRRKKSA